MSLLHLENNFLTIEQVRFASKIISLPSQENPIIEAFVCFLFNIVAITSRNTGKKVSPA
jgi:hypothetical protein